MTINQIKKVHEEFDLVQDIEEFKWLIDRVVSIKPKTILEIGIERGSSLQCWGTICDNVFGFDKSIRMLYSNLNKLLSHIQWFQLDSTNDIAIHIASRLKIDFLFLDGDHTYDGVKKDFENYSHFVRKGGLIGFHDIHDVGGVNKFWNELKSKQYKTEEITKTIGTGLLYV